MSPTLLADSLPAEPPGKPKNLEWVPYLFSLGDLPDPGINLGSPALLVDSLPSEPPGKPQITLDSIVLNTAAAAAAKPLQSCPTLCDPIDGSPPGSPVSGISRQEHWSGLPFPSPMRESEVAQSCPTLRNPVDCSPPGSLVHGIFQARKL